MATLNSPMITTELVDLCETMRQAQLHYDQLLAKRDEYVSAHQVRRADQARKAAEQKVDLYLASYRAELKKYTQAFEPKETTELPGLYSTDQSAGG